MEEEEEEETQFLRIHIFVAVLYIYALIAYIPCPSNVLSTRIYIFLSFQFFHHHHSIHSFYHWFFFIWNIIECEIFYTYTNTESHYMCVGMTGKIFEKNLSLFISLLVLLSNWMIMMKMYWMLLFLFHRGHRFCCLMMIMTMMMIMFLDC